MAFQLRCRDCGVNYYAGEGHKCAPERIREKRAKDEPQVLPEVREEAASVSVGSGDDGVGDGANVVVSRDEGMATASTKSRQQRWNERNRERYNTYMREYRRRLNST